MAWGHSFPPKFANKPSESFHTLHWLWEQWIFLGKRVSNKMWGAGAGSWMERGLTAANTLWKGMSWGTSCVISSFGKLKNSSKLFEEGPFMSPLCFAAVSKALGFKKTNNKQHPNRGASWGGKIPFPPGPGCALRGFWEAERTTKPHLWALPQTESSLFYFLVHFYPCSCQTQPIFTLWTSSLNSSLKT